MISSDLSALLAARYGLGELSLLRVLQERGQRLTLLLDSPAGRLVVKRSAPGREESTVAAETAVLAHLARHAFPAPAPVAARGGELYVPAGECFVSVYRYLEGAPPQPGDALYEQLGALLARLHSLPTAGYDQASPYRPAAILSEARQFLSGALEPGDREAAADLRGIIERFPAFDGLPLGLIHTDPCFENMLALPGGGLALIDWDDSGISYPLLDVAYVVAYLCTFLPWDRERWHVPGEGLVTWRPDWARIFLHSYNAVRPLSPAEKACFPAAVHLNFLVYIRDWETGRLIHENYRRMKIVETFTDPVLG